MYKNKLELLTLQYSPSFAQTKNGNYLEEGKTLFVKIEKTISDSSMIIPATMSGVLTNADTLEIVERERTQSSTNSDKGILIFNTILQKGIYNIKVNASVARTIYKQEPFPTTWTENFEVI